MAGPNLELFKFGLYLFFPLAIMVHYGDPQWYHENVLPVRDQFWPQAESLYRPPRNSEDLRVALEEMKQKRLVRRQERIQQEQEQTSSSTTQSSGHQQHSTSQQTGTRNALQDIKTDSAFTRARASDPTRNQRLV